jgi:hypothetical protein
VISTSALRIESNGIRIKPESGLSNSSTKTIPPGIFWCDSFPIHKASIDLAYLHGRALLEYAVVRGELLAKGHARTGKSGVIARYCGNSSNLDTTGLAALTGLGCWANGTTVLRVRVKALISSVRRAS